MGSDTMASSSREDLEAAKEHFVQTVDFPNISCKIGVRRLNFKKRKSPFLTEDLVFTLNFHPESQNDAEKILIMSSLVFVNEAVISLVDKLKNYFDDSKRRFCFFFAHIELMTSDLFSGARNIHEESSEISAASILEPIYGYLSSNTLIDLKKNRFEIRATVLSFNHSERYDQKRQKRPMSLEDLTLRVRLDD